MKSIWKFKRYIQENGMTPLLIIRIATMVINIFLLLAFLFRWFDENAATMDPFFPDILGMFFAIIGIAMTWTSRKILQYAAIVTTIVAIVYIITG